MNPRPAGEGPDAGRVGVQFLEEGVDGGVLLWERRVDPPFQALADRFDHALGGVEFGTIGRLEDQGDSLGPATERLMGGGAVPDDGLDPGPRPLRHFGLKIGSAHAQRPGPPEPTPAPIDDEQDVAPLPLILQWLHHLHPHRRPHPPRLADQAQAQFVTEADRLLSCHPRRGEGVGEPPFFQAACATWSALGLTGRGTFG